MLTIHAPLAPLDQALAPIDDVLMSGPEAILAARRVVNSGGDIRIRGQHSVDSWEYVEVSFRAFEKWVETIERGRAARQTFRVYVGYGQCCMFVN